MQRPFKQVLSPAAMSVNGICLSQTPLAGGAMTLNGGKVSGGVATLDMPRRVMIKTAADESARTFTIKGTDASGKKISETVVGPNTTSVSSLKDYLTVTEVDVDAATAGALTVGTTDGTTAGSSTPALSSPWIPVSEYVHGSKIGISGRISAGATINWGAQYTLDDPFYDVGTPGQMSQDTLLNPIDHPALQGKVATDQNSIDDPVRAVRAVVTSYSATPTLTMNFVFGR